MPELTISCPKCHTEIPLTESLAAPLIKATREQYEAQLQQNNEAIAKQTQDLSEREKQLAVAVKAMNDQVSQQVEAQLKTEREKIIEEEKIKARRLSETELENRGKQLKDLTEAFENQKKKLAEAQNEQAEFLKKQRELEEAKAALELTVEKKVKATLDDVKTQAKKEAEESLSLKVKEKEEAILSMQKQIEVLKQKAEQGSQQLQGEAQELLLENMLRDQFPWDEIKPVPKGELGADLIHKVISMGGIQSGTIIWESKRTKHWQDSWLDKLREDKRQANAEIAVIVSQVLPKGIETFGEMDGVWITSPRTVVPIAILLRHTLEEISRARRMSEGQQTKAEMVYQYLTSSKFRQRVEAIVESFEAMRNDLEAERKLMNKQWAKREQHIVKVLNATSGMYGDLQGIAGTSIPEIEAFDLKLLDSTLEDSQGGAD